jgi:hypothetical protein
MHRPDGAGNPETMVPVGMAASAGRDRRHPMVAVATASPGRRPLLSLVAQNGTNMTYSCSIRACLKINFPCKDISRSF